MNPKPARFVTPPSVVVQITQLPGLNMQEIRTLWKRLLGGDTPTPTTGHFWNAALPTSCNSSNSAR